MSSFIQRIMPDNFEEYALLGGLSFFSYKIIDHYREKGLSAMDAQKKFNQVVAEKEKAFREKESELIQKFKEKEESLKEKIRQSSISDDARNFIKNL